MKRILNFLAFAAFVISSCNPAGLADEDVKDPLQNYPDDHIKVMSFNIKVDNTDDQSTPNGWGLRKKACVQMIMYHYPTFIGLQEATFTNQWTWLKDQLKENYDGFGLNRDSGLEEGRGEVMGILYNRNQVEKLADGTFWLSETPSQVSAGWGAQYNRTATWGIFRHKKTGRKIVYINSHLDHQVQDARFNGMKLIAKRLSELSSEGDVLLLTGDFNTTADNEAFYHISSTMKNTRSSAPEGQTDNHTTYNNWNTDTNSIIDHIYVSNEVDVVNYRTIYQSYGGLQFLSDHYPVCSLLNIR